MDTITCDLDTFLSRFDTETNAIAHILLAHDDGRVDTIERTIPYYTYNRKANPPRFIAYSFEIPETYSYEVNITNPDGNDLVVVFPRSCQRSMEWFNQHLTHRLSDGYGEFERHEVNITDPTDLERTALMLQREINHRRINRTRIYMIENGASMLPDQFERHYRDVVDLFDENKAISERINDLYYAHHRITPRVGDP